MTIEHEGKISFSLKVSAQAHDGGSDLISNINNMIAQLLEDVKRQVTADLPDRLEETMTKLSEALFFKRCGITHYPVRVIKSFDGWKVVQGLERDLMDNQDSIDFQMGDFS